MNSKCENDGLINELFAAFNQILKRLDSIDLKIDAIDERLSTHMHDEEEEIRATKDTLDKLSIAFPNNDPHGHRAYHEAVIKRLEKRAEFYETMVKELGKYGLIGFAGWLVYTVWVAFLHGPHK